MANSVDTSPHRPQPTSIAVDLRGPVDHDALDDAIATHAALHAAAGVDSVLVESVSPDHTVVFLTHRHADPLGPLPAIAAAYAATRTAVPRTDAAATDGLGTDVVPTSHLPADTAGGILSATMSDALRMRALRDDVDLADVIAAASIESGLSAEVQELTGVGPVSFGDLCGEVTVLRRDSPRGDAPLVRVYRALGDRLRIDLVGVNADPHRRLDRLLAALSSPAATPVPRLWNDTDELTVPATLVDLVDVALARDPDAVAIEFADGADPITYGELDSRVNQVARTLITNGVGTDVVVGVMCVDPVWATVATLAVFRAGGGVLPLPVHGSPETVSGLVAAADPACVVTDRVLSDTDIDPDAVMGEFVRHADVPNILAATDAATDLAESPESLVRSGFDVIPPWVSVVSLDPQELAEYSDDPVCPQELLGPARLGSTAMLGWLAPAPTTPMIISQRSFAARLQWIASIADTDSDSPIVGRDLPDTDSMDSDWMISVLARIAVTAPLRTGASVRRRVTSPSASARRRSSIAHRLAGLGGGSEVIGAIPAWNTETYVLDSRLQALPPGVVGDLYIGGIHLPRGHAGCSASTSSRFVANPFRPGERMLATDILVRRNADGSLVAVESETLAAPAAQRRFGRIGRRA